MVGHLGHTQFDFVGLGLFGEDGAESLRVNIGQLPTAHVAPVVGVSAGIRVLDSAAPETVELVESANRGKAHPVVDLTDLLKRSRRVLGDEKHTPGIRHDHHAATPRDALTCEL